MVDATASSPTAPHLLTTPLPDLAAWTRHFVESDIPVLGNLFKSRARTRAKTNLMIFIRPTILRTAEDIEDCIVLSFAVGDVAVWVERFGCTFEDGRHEGGEWSMFLPRER